MKLTATVTKDENGRLTGLSVLRGRQKKPLKLEFVYGIDGIVRDIEFTGNRADMPNLAEIVDLINESFIERIASIKTIETLSELTLLKKLETIHVIEAIESLPNMTILGSEGVGLKQESGSGAAWVKPTGNSDPDSKWTDEAKAYDSNDATFALHSALDKDTWSGYIILTIGATVCDKVRFRALQKPLEGIVDVDVYKGTQWLNVYYGELENETDIEKSFTEGSITKVRFRFKNSENIKTILRLYEVSLYKIATAGGELDIYVQREGTVTHIDQSSADTQDIVTPASGFKVAVLGFFLKSAGAVVAELKFETSGDLVAGIDAEKGAVGMNLHGLEPPTGAADKKLQLTLDAAVAVRGWVITKDVS